MQHLTSGQQVATIKRRFKELMCRLNNEFYAEHCDTGNWYCYIRSQSTKLPNTTQLLNIEQVLWVLQVGRSTLYNLINQRQLTAVKIGDRTLFRPSDLEEFINNLNQYGD